MKAMYKAKNEKTGMNLPPESYYSQVLSYVSVDVASYTLSVFAESWSNLDHPGISYYFQKAQEYKKMTVK
jgi:hypothetical protein